MAVPDAAKASTKVSRELDPVLNEDLQTYVDAIGSALADVEEMARDDDAGEPWLVSRDIAGART